MGKLVGEAIKPGDAERMGCSQDAGETDSPAIEAQERYLRLRADFDNLRRRAAREQETARRRAGARRSRRSCPCSTRSSVPSRPVPPTRTSTRAWPPRIGSSSRRASRRRRRPVETVGQPVRSQRPRSRRHRAGQRRPARDRGSRDSAGLAARGRRCCVPPRSWSSRRGRPSIRGGEVPRLLRGARRAAHRDGRGDQARLPAARAQAPSRTFKPAAERAAGRRAVQGDQRGQRGAERSRQARASTTRSARTGRVGWTSRRRRAPGEAAPRHRAIGRTSATSATSSRRSSGAGRGGAGAVTCGSPFRGATSRPSCR